MKTLLVKAGINEVVAGKIADSVIALGCETIADVTVLTDKDIMNEITKIEGVNTVISRKALATLRAAGQQATTYSPTFAQMPDELKSPIEIKVTANVEADTATLVKWINIINLYNLNIEDIAQGIKTLVDKRFQTLEVGATPSQLEMYATVNKFTAINDTLGSQLLEKLNIRQSLADSRFDIIEKGNGSFLPDLVVFVNRALDLGIDVQSVSLETIRRILGVQKIGNNVNLEDLTMAANQFISECNTHLKGLNTLVIQETYDLYHELFALLDSKELQAFLGARDKEDLLRAMGVSITPKQARTYAALPQCIFTLIDAAKNGELQDKEKLYVYLQTAWSAMRTLDLMGVVPQEAKRAIPSVTFNM